MGSQEYAVVVDSLDNIYVISGSGNTLVAQAFVKGVGYTWTPGTVRSASMPSYSDGRINNVAAAWHNVGTSGTIMVVASHTAGRAPNNTGDASYALLNCQYLLTGTGSLLRNSGAARGVVVHPTVAIDDYTSYVNPSGAMLDVMAAPGTTNRGYVLCTSPLADIGDEDYVVTYRYVLASDGASISDTDDNYFPTGLRGIKDASAKLRVIGIDSSVFVGVAADDSAATGLRAEVMQNFGTSSTFSVLGRVSLGTSPATIPSAATLATSQAWDAIYDPTGNKVWFYYFSVADGRRLMRTSIDLNTYLAVQDEVEVSAAVGAAGSTNYAIRVHRGPLNARQTLVSVANKTSGGVHSTQYVLDSLNVAPTAPTLTAKANFDATAAATFAWTFNDPNAGDTQSAYELQINTSGGVFEYDTAKVGGSAATYVGSGAAASGNNVSLTPAVPSGNAGDTLLCFASIRNSGTGTVGTAPTGWQTLLTFGNTAVLGKVADAASETAPTVTFSGGVANADTLARIHRFRNLPLNLVASATVLNGSAANVTYPALTVPLNNSVVFVYGWKQDDWTSVAALAGMTEVDDSFSTAGDDAAQAVDYVIQTTAANITSSAFTVTGGLAAISRGITLSVGPAGHTATAQSHTLGANILANGASWQWRVRTWDAAGLVGAWSSFSTFSTAAGGNVTITSPASDNPGGQITDDYTITWSTTGTTQASYRVKVVRTSDSSVLSDTGFVASVATSANITGLLSGVEYRVEVTVRNAGLVESGTGTRLITPSYGSPDTPTMTVTVTAGLPYILVSVDNPTPTGDRPLPTVNQILRRVSGSGDAYVAVGTCGVDGSFKDYAVASGVTYEYVARAVAA